MPLQDPQGKISTGAAYKTTLYQDEELQKCLDGNLLTRKVRRSRSATGTPIMFVLKKDGSLRLVIDYRPRNHLNIPNKYPLPLISELLDKTRGS